MKTPTLTFQSRHRESASLTAYKSSCCSLAGLKFQSRHRESASLTAELEAIRAKGVDFCFNRAIANRPA